MVQQSDPPESMGYPNSKPTAAVKTVPELAAGIISASDPERHVDIVEVTGSSPVSSTGTRGVSRRKSSQAPGRQGPFLLGAFAGAKDPMPIGDEKLAAVTIGHSAASQ